jgi:curved DNA-binding protein CbpA
MGTGSKDKRHFKRYRRKSNFSVNINGKSYQAETIDYSLDGLGALVEDSPPLTNGLIVDLNINPLNISSKGEVVWARKSNSGTMVGIRRLDFPKNGNLNDYFLADILIGLQRIGKTGILEVRSNDILKKVYIKNGDMVFSTSNQNDDRLGDILLKERKISSIQYDHSVEMMKETGRRQGAILVELGYLKPQELIWAVRHQVEEIIMSLLGFKNGSFEFKEGPLPTEEVITLKLSAANIIYRGIKRLNEFDNLKHFFDLAMDTILCLSPDPMTLFQDIKFDDTDKKILSYIDGKTQVKDIILLSQLGDSMAFKSLFALLSTGIVEIKTEDEAHVEVSAAEFIEESETETEIDEEFIDKVENIYSNFESISYYGILDIDKFSSPAEIKKAYYKAAKEFHPDRHFHLKSDTVKEKLNHLFSYVTAAYTTLSDPQKRNEYDRLLSVKSVKTASNEELARSRFEEGMKEIKNGNYSGAYELFGQATYLHKDVGDYHYYYGICLVRLKRLKEASKAIERAVQCKPMNVNYMTELGYVYLQMGFPQRARSNFDKVLKIDPSNKLALSGLKKIQDSGTA